MCLLRVCGSGHDFLDGCYSSLCGVCFAWRSFDNVQDFVACVENSVQLVVSVNEILLRCYKRVPKALFADKLVGVVLREFAFGNEFSHNLMYSVSFGCLIAPGSDKAIPREYMMMLVSSSTGSVSLDGGVDV